MQHAAYQDKHMPNRVMVSQLLPNVEDHPKRVEETTPQEQQQPSGFHRREHRFDCDHHQPAEPQIEAQLKALVALLAAKFQHHAGDSDSPDQDKEGPPPTAPQIDQRERGIGAGN